MGQAEAEAFPPSIHPGGWQVDGMGWVGMGEAQEGEGKGSEWERYQMADCNGDGEIQNCAALPSLDVVWKFSQSSISCLLVSRPGWLRLGLGVFPHLIANTHLAMP